MSFSVRSVGQKSRDGEVDDAIAHKKTTPIERRFVSGNPSQLLA